MALTTCPECSRPVSDKAAACPACGYPLQAQASPPQGVGDEEVKEVIRREGKIAAIKRYRELKPSTGLAEAKDHIDRLASGIPPSQITSKTARGCLSTILLAGFLLSGGLLLAFRIWSS